MKRDAIKSVFESLARSQGFYGRLLNNIEQADPEQREEFWAHLEAQNFRDMLDVVMFIEC